jgi:hypothetical protein
MARRPVSRAYEGACHCGAIEYVYETAASPRSWSVRACQCAFCRGHGAIVTSDPAGSVRFRYVLPDRLRRYRFALRTADFLLCRECGMYLGAVMLAGAGALATVNVNLLRERPRGLATARKVSYAGEPIEERRARRRGLWTPVFGPV